LLDDALASGSVAYLANALGIIARVQSDPPILPRLSHGVRRMMVR
jgi:hypothetical protein